MARRDYYYNTEAPEVNSIVAAASAVVTTLDGKIVLNRRVDNDLWSLLGGGMEYGECIKDTIIREVREEAGIEVIVKKIIGIYTDPNHVIEYSDGEVRQEFSVCFHCVTEQTSFEVSSESKEVRAFNYEEIAGLRIHPSQIQRIEDFLENKEEAFIR